MKVKSFLDSLQFNAAMSVVSVALLAQKIIRNILSGDYYQEFIIIIIWIVIAFHFIKTTKERMN
jgi:hypothetical protein